jgi:inosine/xanthosine triphosphate pyrophosphatase family protein
VRAERRCCWRRATPDKLRRLRWIVEGLPFEPTNPTADEARTAPDEQGDTHLEVARHKARWWSRHHQGVALASDGGVDIPELGQGWRSVRTRRASAARDDAERVADLLARMGDLRGDARRARWAEAIALAANGELLGAWQAWGPDLVVANRAKGERPEGGFWLETLLADPATGRTLASLPTSERRRFDRAWTTLRPLVRGRLLQWQAQAPAR